MSADTTELAIVPRIRRAGRFSVVSRINALSSRIQKAQVLSDTNLVLKIITGGTIFVMTVISGLLLASFAIGNHYVLPRLVVALAFLAYAVTVGVLVRRGRAWAATLMILILYTFIGVVIVTLWGLNVASGELIFGTVIVLAGVLLGARSIIPTTGIVIIILAAVQSAITTGLVEPDTRSLGQDSNLIDLIAYAAIFVFVAVVSWLSGRRMEQSLARALQAEADLQVEKDMLAVRLEERERSLREAQLEEMRQLYHFAELGQLGTVVLHDLANNLTALTLDIDDIEKQNRSSSAVSRARESIGYLDDMVAAARRQLRRNDKPVVFDALEQIAGTIDALRPKAERAGVVLKVTGRSRHSTFTVIGDPLRFAQILTVLVTNAIEAYAGTGVGSPAVTVTTHARRGSLELAVTDHGRGIDAAGRKLVFQPFHSTKPNGMGIGLFITREIVERHFKGSITLDKQRPATRFVVRLPEYHDA